MADEFEVGDKVEYVGNTLGLNRNEQYIGQVGVVTEVDPPGYEGHVRVTWDDGRTDPKVPWHHNLKVVSFRVGDTVKVDDLPPPGAEAWNVRGTVGTVVDDREGGFLAVDFGEGSWRRWNTEVRYLTRVIEPVTVEEVREYLIKVARQKGWCRSGVNRHLAALRLKPWTDSVKVTIEVEVEGTIDEEQAKASLRVVTSTDGWTATKV